ncbi:MAG TPA: hypothetical protein VFG14_02975 [Chthoniobacteraceae bacterium]|nr:hypothetical protein [Chthoniobacteraceae bacterium]
MARRASSSAHPLWLVLAAVLVLGAIGGGLLIRSQSDPFRTVTTLPIKDYLENSSSLRGNVYKLSATVAKTIEVSRGSGRLFAIESGGEMLAVLVPPELNQMNIERGQNFVFKLEVAEKGILRVQEVRKS